MSPTKSIKKTDPDLRITVAARPETLPIEGNVSVSGDKLADRRVEKETRADLDRGNQWAWCTAVVRVVYRGTLEAEAKMPAVSFSGEDQFRVSQEFADMVTEALVEINRQLAVLSAKGSK